MNTKNKAQEMEANLTNWLLQVDRLMTSRTQPHLNSLTTVFKFIN